MDNSTTIVVVVALGALALLALNAGVLSPVSEPRPVVVPPTSAPPAAADPGQVERTAWANAIGGLAGLGAAITAAVRAGQTSSTPGGAS